MKYAETIFKKLHIIIILLKTKYLQYSVISRFSKRHFINYFDISQVLVKLNKKCYENYF